MMDGENWILRLPLGPMEKEGKGSKRSALREIGKKIKKEMQENEGLKGEKYRVCKDC